MDRDVCAVCGTNPMITRAGKLRVHNVDRFERCPGSGHDPGELRREHPQGWMELRRPGEVRPGVFRRRRV